MAAIDIKKEAKNPYGAYLLFGEEDYLKRYYASEIRRAVVGDSPYAPFNHILFSPDNFTAGAAADALVTPPVFEEKKLIELCAFNFNELKATETSALCDFLEEAKNYDYAVILINIPSGALDYGIAKSGKINRPSSLFKALDAAAKTAYFPRAGLRQLNAWADKHFGTEGIKAGEAELRALISLAGSDMMTLAGEIEKTVRLPAHTRTQPTHRSGHRSDLLRNRSTRAVRSVQRHPCRRSGQRARDPLPHGGKTRTACGRFRRHIRHIHRPLSHPCLPGRRYARA